jgi:hypothetical protein
MGRCNRDRTARTTDVRKPSSRPSKRIGSAAHLHALDDAQAVVNALGLLQSDDTVAADAGHGVGDHGAHLGVVASGHCHK